MGNEATITVGLVINKTGLQVLPFSLSFQADVIGTKGPSPGSIEVSVTGTNVSFAALAVPGWGFIYHQGRADGVEATTDNYVDYGSWDGTASLFRPLFRLYPGQAVPVQFSPDLGEELPGTGTLGTEDNPLRFRAHGAACNILIAAFEA